MKTALILLSSFTSAILSLSMLEDTDTNSTKISFNEEKGRSESQSRRFIWCQILQWNCSSMSSRPIDQIHILFVRN